MPENAAMEAREADGLDRVAVKFAQANITAAETSTAEGRAQLTDGASAPVGSPACRAPEVPQRNKDPGGGPCFVESLRSP